MFRPNSGEDYVLLGWSCVSICTLVAKSNARVKRDE